MTESNARRFRKKPVVIEAIAFDELVAHGVRYCRECRPGWNMANNIPWAFQYRGLPITHETDDCYLIPTLEGTMRFERGDMLITGVKGEIYPCKPDIFAATYEPASAPGSGEGRELREDQRLRAIIHHMTLMLSDFGEHDPDYCSADKTQHAADCKDCECGLREAIEFGVEQSGFSLEPPEMTPEEEARLHEIGKRAVDKALAAARAEGAAEEREKNIRAIRAACQVCGGSGVERDVRVIAVPGPDGEPVPQEVDDSTECPYCGYPIAAIKEATRD